MAIAVPNQWNDTTGTVDNELTVTPTSGNWLIAIVVWTTTNAAVQPAINLTDPSRNVWWLLATKIVPANQTGLFTSGPLNVQVWACPAAQFAGWSQMRVYTSIATITGGDLGSVCMKIVEVSGMGNGFLTVDSVVVTTANAANSVTVALPAPAGGADCLMIAAAAGTIAYGSYSTSGTGWAQLSNSTNINPNIGLFSAWREGATGSSATFSLATGFTCNWAAVGVSIRQTGVIPAQPNPHWPLIETQIGLGYTLSTPLSGVWWTTLTNPFPSLGTKHGIGYELGTAQAEPTDLLIRNTDGALTPKAAVTGTATANGTTTTFLCSDTDGANFNVGDFVKLTASALNPNPSFESGTTGWAATGGTLTTTTSVGAIGTYAGQMTPDGTSATTQVKPASHVTVTPRVVYTFSAWVRCAVTRTVDLRAIWYDSANTFISNNIIQVNVAANTWVYTTGMFTAPANAASVDIAPTMTGTPPASNIMYLDTVDVHPTSESTIFKVTGKSSVSGTTTISYAEAGESGGSLQATRIGDTLTSTPVDVYTPYRVLAAWDGKRHYVTAGWAERWPETWTSDGFIGSVTMTGTGVLANLTASNPSCLSGEITRRAPYAYWPLSDAAGSSVAQNVSGRGSAVLTVTDSSHGTSGTNAFGVSTQGVEDPFFIPTRVSSLLGDTGNGWQQTGISSADFNANKGTALVGSDTGFPPIGNGVTIFFVHYFNEDQAVNTFDGTKNPTVIAVKNTDSSAGHTGAVIKFAMQTGSTGYLMPVITAWDRSTGASTTTQCNTGGQWGNYGAFNTGALSFNRTSWKAYTVGGVLSGSGTCNLADKFSIIDAAGEADQYYNGNFCPGIFTHIAMFDRMLSDGEISALNSAFNAHSGDEYTSNRVQRKLDTISLRTGRAISYEGQKVCGAEGSDGSTIADINNIIGGYEDALVFEDAGANYQYRPPAMYDGQTPVAVLGERTDLGEVPYQPGVIADFDPTYIYNSITITNSRRSQDSWNQSIGTTEFVAADSGSSSKYGVRPLPRDTRLQNDSDVTALASRLLSRYSTTKRRISEITIDPASNPDAWTFCLTVEVGDIVTIKRRPLYAAETSIDCQVLQVAHTTSPGVWKTTLTLAPAP